MEKNRYAKVNDRLDTVVREIQDRGTEPETEFDHTEWLLCEREALLLERDRLEKILSAEGEVQY